MTYLSTASFATYLLPFAFLYWHARDARRRTDTEPAPWYEHLGFRLPPMYPTPPELLTSTQLGEPTRRERSLPARPELRPLRPSSIDGRRPRSNLNVRIDIADASHKQRPRNPLGRGRSWTVRGLGEREELMPGTATPTYGSEEEEESASETSVQFVPASELPPLSIVETGVLAMQFATVWFAANWSFIAALGYTSVASGTTLGASSGFFTLLLGSMVGTDSFSPGKLASVVLRYVAALT